MSTHPVMAVRRGRTARRGSRSALRRRRPRPARRCSATRLPRRRPSRTGERGRRFRRRGRGALITVRVAQPAIALKPSGSSRGRGWSRTAIVEPMRASAGMTASGVDQLDPPGRQQLAMAFGGRLRRRTSARQRTSPRAARSEVPDSLDGTREHQPAVAGSTTSNTRPTERPRPNGPPTRCSPSCGRCVRRNVRRRSAFLNRRLARAFDVTARSPAPVTLMVTGRPAPGCRRRACTTPAADDPSGSSARSAGHGRRAAARRSGSGEKGDRGLREHGHQVGPAAP